MEKFDILETKKAEKPEQEPTKSAVQESENEHSEAVEFVEKHRDFLEHYAKGRVKILPAPEGVKTFGFNLETNEIYVNSMFYKKRGFPDEKTLFGVCHEAEHFGEKRVMLSEEGGEKKFEKYLKRIKTSKAFSLMDNCVSDIRENRAVVERTNKGMGELEEKIYKEDLFAETDFTSQPRHIQLSQAILREARLSGEKCVVSPDVRLALDEVAKVKGLMEVMTNPETAMSIRLKLQDKYIWPKVEALLEKDMEDKKKQQEQKKKEKGEGEGEPGDQGDEKGDKKQGQEGSEEDKKDESKEGKKGKSDKDKKSGKKDGEEREEKPASARESSGEAKADMRIC